MHLINTVSVQWLIEHPASSWRQNIRAPLGARWWSIHSGTLPSTETHLSHRSSLGLHRDMRRWTEPQIPSSPHRDCWRPEPAARRRPSGTDRPDADSPAADPRRQTTWPSLRFVSTVQHCSSRDVCRQERPPSRRGVRWGCFTCSEQNTRPTHISAKVANSTRAVSATHICRGHGR